MRERDPVGYARRNFVVLFVLFAAFVALGLWRDNIAALVGGAAGIAWLAWAKWRA